MPRPAVATKVCLQNGTIAVSSPRMVDFMDIGKSGSRIRMQTSTDGDLMVLKTGQSPPPSPYSSNFSLPSGMSEESVRLSGDRSPSLSNNSVHNSYFPKMPVTVGSPNQNPIGTFARTPSSEFLPDELRSSLIQPKNRETPQYLTWWPGKVSTPVQLDRPASQMSFENHAAGFGLPPPLIDTNLPPSLQRHGSGSRSGSLADPEQSRLSQPFNSLPLSRPLPSSARSATDSFELSPLQQPANLLSLRDLDYAAGQLSSLVSLRHPMERVEAMARRLGTADSAERARLLQIFSDPLTPNIFLPQPHPELKLSEEAKKEASELLSADLSLLDKTSMREVRRKPVEDVTRFIDRETMTHEQLQQQVDRQHRADTNEEFERCKNAHAQLADMLEPNSSPAVRLAVLEGLKLKLQPNGAENRAVLALYQSNVYNDQPGAKNKLAKMSLDIASYPVGSSFQNHVQSCFMGEDKNWDARELSTFFGLHGRDKTMADHMLYAPLHLVDRLDNPRGRRIDGTIEVIPLEESSQRENLNRIKSAIGAMTAPDQYYARQVMLLGLSSRLGEINSERLKLETMQFLNTQFTTDLSHHGKGLSHVDNLSEPAKIAITNNMMDTLRGMKEIESAATRHEFLASLSATMDASHERGATNGVNYQRETLLAELSEVFFDLKKINPRKKNNPLEKNKRETIEMIGRATRDLTTAVTVSDPASAYDGQTIEPRPKISQDTQLSVLGNLLKVAGDIHSVKTQRQILVEVARTMNDPHALDAEGKKELAIMLGKSIPKFHCSTLNSGRNMQHKAYKLFRTIMQEQRNVEVSLRGDPTSVNGILNKNATPFSERQITEMIAEVSTTLPKQNNDLRAGKHSYINHDLVDSRRWPQVSKKLREKPVTGTAKQGVKVIFGGPIDLALAAKPLMFKRPPIRTSLALNMMERLDQFPEAVGTSRFQKLETMQARQAGWASLLDHSDSLDPDVQHKVVERFLKTVEVRDSEIKQAHALTVTYIDAAYSTPGKSDAECEQLALDYIVQSYAVINDPRTNHDARINGLTLGDFRARATPAVQEIARLHREMRSELENFERQIDKTITEATESRGLRGKFKLSKRSDDKKRIKELEELRISGRKNMEAKLARDIAAVKFPHLEIYKESFAPAFQALHAVSSSIENRFREGLPGQKKKLSDRVRDSIAAHDSSMPATLHAGYKGADPIPTPRTGPPQRPPRRDSLIGPDVPESVIHAFYNGDADDQGSLNFEGFVGIHAAAYAQPLVDDPNVIRFSTTADEFSPLPSPVPSETGAGQFQFFSPPSPAFSEIIDEANDRLSRQSIDYNAPLGPLNPSPVKDGRFF